MKQGFTLIETLVYLALYALLMAGVFSAAYSFSESSSRNETSAFVEEEGTFLIGKIDWSLGNVTSIQSPQISGTVLQLTQADGTNILIRLDGEMMRMQADAHSEEVISSTNVSLENLNFVHTADPEQIDASFTLSATTSDGHPVSADFSTTDYLPE